MRSVRKVTFLFSVLTATSVSIIIAEDAKRDLSQAIGNYLSVSKKNVQFLEITTNFLRENKERFTTISNEIKELNVELGETKIKDYNDKTESVITEASNEYGKMIQIMSEACTKSKDIYNQLMNLPRLDDNTWNFFETSKWVMKEQVRLLQMSVDETSSRSKTAYGYIEQVRGKISRFSGTLLSFEQDLENLANDKQWEIDGKKFSSVPANYACLGPTFATCRMMMQGQRNFVNNLVTMRSRIQRYREDSENWIGWIKQTTSDLKKLANDDDDTIANFKGQSEYGGDLVGKVETFLSGYLDNGYKEWIIKNSNRIYSAAEEINNKCHRYDP